MEVSCTCCRARKHTYILRRHDSIAAMPVPWPCSPTNPTLQGGLKSFLFLRNSQLNSLRPFRVSLAPLPNDILWQHWDVHSGNRVFRLLITAALLVGLTFFWFTPMLFVTGFTSAQTLRRAFPGLDDTFGDGSTVLVSGWLSYVH